MKENIIVYDAYQANLSIKHIFLRKKEKNEKIEFMRFHVFTCQIVNFQPILILKTVLQFSFHLLINYVLSTDSNNADPVKQQNKSVNLISSTAPFQIFTCGVRITFQPLFSFGDIEKVFDFSLR